MHKMAVWQKTYHSPSTNRHLLLGKKSSLILLEKTTSHKSAVPTASSLDNPRTVMAVVVMAVFIGV